MISKSVSRESILNQHLVVGAARTRLKRPTKLNQPRPSSLEVRLLGEEGVVIEVAFVIWLFLDSPGRFRERRKHYVALKVVRYHDAGQRLPFFGTVRDAAR